MNIGNANTAGISQVKLLQLKRDVQDCLEKMNLIFQKYSDLVESSKVCLDCTSGDFYRSKFYDMKDNFVVVNKNISGYIEDLSRVELLYNKMQTDSAEMIDQAAIHIINKKEEII